MTRYRFEITGQRLGRISGPNMAPTSVTLDQYRAVIAPFVEAGIELPAASKRWLKQLEASK